MSLSHDERRVLGLTTLSATDAPVFVRLWLRSPDVQDVLMNRPGLRSAVLRRQATMQTVRRNSHEPPPTLLYNANAPPRKRWRSLPPTGPAHVEHTSAVDDDEVGRQIKEAWAGNSDADTALRRLERDLRAVGRSPPTMLTRFVAGRPRRRGKRGPDPAKLHLLRVTVFGLLQELEKRGIAPTQLGAVLVAEELRRQGVRSSPEAVIGIWKTGSRAIRGK